MLFFCIYLEEFPGFDLAKDPGRKLIIMYIACVSECMAEQYNWVATSLLQYDSQTH
jgi:hypothetical protein